MSISAAICTYNRRELAMSCLGSLLAQDADLAGITIVDNASEDGTREALERAFGDRVMVIPSDHNLGSSGGFHLAIENACRESSDYVLLLDSDTELAPGALAAMVTYLEENPDVWVVGPKIYWPGTERRIQTFGTRIDWATTELIQGYRDLAEGTAAQIIGTLEVDCVLACCALVRREVFAKVGNIDPRFFVYMDDVEWCWRVKEAGGRLAMISAAEVIHHCSNRRVKKNHFTTYYCWRNEVFFFLTHCPNQHRIKMELGLLHRICRAVATSEALGLVNAGQVIETAAWEGATGQLGARDFGDLKVEIDSPSPFLSTPEESSCIHKVNSIFEMENDELDDHSWYRDDFGKSIQGVDLKAALPIYQEAFERVQERFTPLFKVCSERQNRMIP